jgi:tetratricopeptide (TPR) repeat protein
VDEALSRADDIATWYLLGPQRRTLSYWRGAADLSAAHFTKAVVELSAIPRGDARFADARARRGIAYFQLRDEARAEADLDEALQLDPNNGTAHYYLGQLMARRQEFDRALLHYDEAVRCQPSLANAYIARGQAELALKVYDRAMADGNTALRMNKNNAAARTLLSDVMAAVAATRPNTAPAKTRGPVSIPHPLNEIATPNDLFAAAAAAAAAHDDQRALDLYAKYLSASSSADALCVGHMNRGNIFLAEKKLDEALAEYDEAVRADPSNAGAFIDRGLCRSDRDDIIGAYADYNTAISINSQFAEAYYNRGHEHWRHGEYEAALPDAATAIGLKPDFAEAFGLRADCYAHLHNIGAANEAVQQLRKISLTKAAGALNAIAWVEATSRDTGLRDGEAAVDAAREACELSRWTDAAMIDTLAAAYAERCDFEAAAQTEEKALTMMGSRDQSRAAAAASRLALYRKQQPFRE